MRFKLPEKNKILLSRIWSSDCGHWTTWLHSN